MRKKIFDLVASKQAVLNLFGIFILLLVPISIFPEFKPVLIKPINIILAIIGLGLVICTSIRLNTLHRSTLVIHCATLIILAGALISSFGYVATINIYEGDTIDRVYNWDIEQEMRLSNELRVAKINFSYYPAPVKIGVLKDGQKARLVETRTGESFFFDQYLVSIVELDPSTEVAQLSIEQTNGMAIGTISTDGQRSLPQDFPLDFKLVAYKDPPVKRMWVVLEILNNGQVVKTGTSEVNHPLRWQGIKYFLTQVNFNNIGKPYAGIQLSRDPGVPFIYTGFAIFFLGVLLAFRRWKRQVF